MAPSLPNTLFVLVHLFWICLSPQQCRSIKAGPPSALVHSCLPHAWTTPGHRRCSISTCLRTSSKKLQEGAPRSTGAPSWAHTFSSPSQPAPFPSTSQRIWRWPHVHYSLSLIYSTSTHPHTKSFSFCLQNTSWICLFPLLVTITLIQVTCVYCWNCWKNKPWLVFCQFMSPLLTGLLRQFTSHLQNPSIALTA